ncbi:MAG: hypothetical protein RIE08_09050 [Acidimicrobiales bacterium]
MKRVAGLIMVAVLAAACGGGSGTEEAMTCTVDLTDDLPNRDVDFEMGDGRIAELTELEVDEYEFRYDLLDDEGFVVSRETRSRPTAGSESFDEVTTEVDATDCVVVEISESGGDVVFVRDEPSATGDLTGAQNEACQAETGAVLDAAEDIGIGGDEREDLIDSALTQATDDAGDVDFDALEEVVADLLSPTDWYPSACAASFDADGEQRRPSGGVEVSFTLLGTEGDEYSYDILGGCEGDGGYGDIREGMIMNMTDQFGDVISIASLDASFESFLGCELSGRFSITYAELDLDSTYLIGDRQGRRGELAFTGQELIDNDGVQLSLG